MRKILLALALTTVGVSLSGCWHGHDHGWGDHNAGHGGYGDHGGPGDGH